MQENSFTKEFIFSPELKVEESFYFEWTPASVLGKEGWYVCGVISTHVDYAGYDAQGPRSLIFAYCDIRNPWAAKQYVQLGKYEP